MTDQTPHDPAVDETQPGDLPDDIDLDEDDYDDEYEPEDDDEEDAGPPHPVNWHLLRADPLEKEWYALNRWVETIRRTYGLPASVIPPFWHRHDELVWELSALHLHWLCAYHPEQDGSAPFGWHRDFADARQRLREWVAASGTRLDRDRPTRQTVWPGEEPRDPIEDIPIIDRDAEFVEFVMADVQARREAEEALYRDLDPGTGEVS